MVHELMSWLKQTIEYILNLQCSYFDHIMDSKEWILKLSIKQLGQKCTNTCFNRFTFFLSFFVLHTHTKHKGQPCTNINTILMQVDWLFWSCNITTDLYIACHIKKNTSKSSTLFQTIGTDSYNYILYRLLQLHWLIIGSLHLFHILQTFI